MWWSLSEPIASGSPRSVLRAYHLPEVTKWGTAGSGEGILQGSGTPAPVLCMFCEGCTARPSVAPIGPLFGTVFVLTP